jgi:hypothetical protein
MFFLAGAAASSALDLISTLQQSLTAKTPAVAGFDPISTTGSPGATATAPSAPVAPATMNALLSVQGQPGRVNGDAFSKQLFSMLDGTISKSEFEAALAKNGSTTKADSIFAQLDADGDGAVSQDELTSALQKGSEAHHHHGHHHGAGGISGSGGASASGGAGGANDPLTQSDTSQTVTNADGSSTTTIKYADGSQVATTTPAGGSGTSMNHFLERLIQRQAQMLASPPAGQSLTMSV